EKPPPPERPGPPANSRTTPTTTRLPTSRITSSNGPMGIIRSFRAPIVHSEPRMLSIDRADRDDPGLRGGAAPLQLDGDAGVREHPQLGDRAGERHANRR